VMIRLRLKMVSHLKTGKEPLVVKVSSGYCCSGR